MTQAVIVTADAVFPVASAPVVGHPGDPAAVLVAHGHVEAVGTAREVIPSPAAEGASRVDLPGCVITPGLVNTHCHLQYSCFGQAIATREFFPWIRAVTSLISVMDAGAWLASSGFGALQNLRAGVTTIADVFSREESLAAMEESGLTGVAFFEVLGPSKEEASDAVKALERRLPKLLGAAAAVGAHLGLSPHAPYTCHPSLFAAMRRIADREGLPLATHVAETREEVDLFADGSGPFALYIAARRDDFEPPGRTPIAYLDDLGVWAGHPTLAIHAVHATQEDLHILAERGAAVVTCPSSNTALRAGQADVPAMLDAGLTVAVGSDSLASTEAIDILDELGELARRHPEIGPEKLLAMGTADGAQALGLPAGTGTLVAGARADLAAFPMGVTPADAVAPERLLARLFATAPRARAVMRGGRWLLVDGEPKTIDARAVEREAARATHRLRDAARAL